MCVLMRDVASCAIKLKRSGLYPPGAESDVSMRPLTFSTKAVPCCDTKVGTPKLLRTGSPLESFFQITRETSLGHSHAFALAIASSTAASVEAEL